MERNRIKVFEPFQDVSNPSTNIDAIMIIYGFYKRSSHTIMKGIRIENMGNARNEYKKLLEEGWEEDKYFWKIF